MVKQHALIKQRFSYPGALFLLRLKIVIKYDEK